MTASELFAPHTGDHCAEPVSPAVAVIRYFCRVIAAMRRERSAPEARTLASGAASTPPSHPVTEPGGVPVLSDQMLSQVREQWNAFHDDMPAVPTFTPSEQMDTGEFAVPDARVDAVLRPVNGRNLGTQPRRQPVYGERCQLDVERDMALAAGERARQGYVPASPRLLDQVLAGLRKL